MKLRTRRKRFPITSKRKRKPMPDPLALPEKLSPLQREKAGLLSAEFSRLSKELAHANTKAQREKILQDYNRVRREINLLTYEFNLKRPFVKKSNG